MWPILISLLPHHALSLLWRHITHSKIKWLKTILIQGFIQRYHPNLSEAEREDPHTYESLNDFFTRQLKPTARPLPKEGNTVISPADGQITAWGFIENNQLIQAKGFEYSVESLLAHSRAEPFKNGQFVTIYLSPKNYHRVHMPSSGRLIEIAHVPGRLFPVNSHHQNHVHSLFSRNERVIVVFETIWGKMAVILVGALLVGNIHLSIEGKDFVPEGHVINRWTYDSHPIHLERGEELGRFEMGSTVIVLFESRGLSWAPNLSLLKAILMGESLGTRPLPNQVHNPHIHSKV